MVRLLEVEPLIRVSSVKAVAPLLHWKVRGAEPVTEVVKTTVLPLKLVRLSGWDCKTGGAAMLKNAGGELVSVPATFDTTTAYGPTLGDWKFVTVSAEAVAV